MSSSRNVNIYILISFIAKVNATTFDIWCAATRRSYHFTDCDGAGSQMWADLVGAMLDKQKEDA